MAARRISVDLNDFRNAANEIEKYLSFMASNMNKADSNISVLKQAGWHGIDAEEFIKAWKRLFGEQSFIKAWKRLFGEQSTYSSMRKVLQSYIRYLRYVANRYESAQNYAKELAAKL